MLSNTKARTIIETLIPLVPIHVLPNTGYRIRHETKIQKHARDRYQHHQRIIKGSLAAFIRNAISSVPRYPILGFQSAWTCVQAVKETSSCRSARNRARLTDARILSQTSSVPVERSRALSSSRASPDIRGHHRRVPRKLRQGCSCDPPYK
jgi:hypothetical protein